MAQSTRFGEKRHSEPTNGRAVRTGGPYRPATGSRMCRHLPTARHWPRLAHDPGNAHFHGGAAARRLADDERCARAEIVPKPSFNIRETYASSRVSRSRGAP